METSYRCLVFALALIPLMSAAQGTIKNGRTKSTEDIMVIDENKKIIRKLYEALNGRDMEMLPELIDEEYTGIHGLKGVEGFQEPVSQLIKAFPDIQWDIEELIGEADKVVVRWKWRGSHKVQFSTFTPTNKTITNEGMAIFHLKNRRITNAQLQTDRLGFLQELGVLPIDLTLLPNKQEDANQVRFIDKFLVPAAAKQEFYDRMRINRQFIKNLPGFIEDNAFEYTDQDGNLICITIALWENEGALSSARAAVQTEYKKQGFDPSEMFKRLKIVADRGVYRRVVDD